MLLGPFVNDAVANMGRIGSGKVTALGSVRDFGTSAGS